jgi:hypothetical protein
MSSKSRPRSKKAKKTEKKIDEAESLRQLYEHTGPTGLKPSSSMGKVSFQKTISRQPSQKKFEVFSRYLKHKYGESPDLPENPKEDDFNFSLPQKRKSQYYLQNLYDLLKLAPSSEKSEIIRSYRKQVVIHHPDKGGDPFLFRCVNKAYEILSNDELRTVYDNEGLKGIKDMSEVDLTDIEAYLSKFSS